MLLCVYTERWNRQVWLRGKDKQRWGGPQLNEITSDHEKSPAWLSLHYLYSSSPVFFVFAGILVGWRLYFIIIIFFFMSYCFHQAITGKSFFYYYFYFNYRFERKKIAWRFRHCILCVHYTTRIYKSRLRPLSRIPTYS